MVEVEPLRHQHGDHRHHHQHRHQRAQQQPRPAPQERQVGEARVERDAEDDQRHAQLQRDGQQHGDRHRGSRSVIGTMIVRHACHAMGHWSYAAARPTPLRRQPARSAGDRGLCANAARGAIGPWGPCGGRAAWGERGWTALTDFGIMAALSKIDGRGAMRTPSQPLPRIAGAAALALCSLPGAALAELPQDVFWGELSWFYPTINSTARLDVTATSRPGSVITLEDDLDLDERKSTPYLQLGMRLGERWRLEFEYYDLSRSATKTLARTIDWGDTTFPVGVTVDTTFDTTIYRFTGGYSFVRDAASEVGVGFGLHITDFQTALAGTGNGPSGTNTFHNEKRDALVPLPTAGLYGTYKFTDQLSVRGRVDLLSFKYDEYDGRLVNWMAALDWRFAKNWGAGIGYRYVDYKLEAESSDFRGEINYKFKGPTLFLNAAF
jgi:hypothetical protein